MCQRLVCTLYAHTIGSNGKMQQTSKYTAQQPMHTAHHVSTSRITLSHRLQLAKGRNTARTAALPPQQLVGIAAEPVVKVALICGAGAICARRDILTLQGRRMLSSLVLNVFTPALLLSKLGSTVDAKLALSLWPLAANMGICHVVGLGLGWCQYKLLNMPDNLRPQTIVMSALANIGNLPLVLVPALIASPDVLISAEGKEMGITYVMLGFFIASFIQFPLGYLFLQQPQQHLAGNSTAAAEQAAKQKLPVSAAPAPTCADIEAAAAAANTTTLTAQGQQQQVMAVEDGTAIAVVAAVVQQREDKFCSILKNVFSPPVIACLLAIPVGTVHELRDQIFSPTGSLSVLGDALGLLGSPLIPCLFLVLGANLAEGPGAAMVPPRYVISTIISKLVLHPLAGMAIVLGALHAGLLPAGTDPLIPLVMMMVYAMPTAVLVHSLATMLQASEDQVSCFLFWQYLASLVTLPAFMAVYLQLLQSGQLAVPSV